MEWTAKTVDRLYDLYVLHDDRLRADIIEANRALGSAQPDRVKLERMTRAEFDTLVRGEPFDARARQLWLRGIVRGYEQEFPELAAIADPRQIA